MGPFVVASVLLLQPSASNWIDRAIDALGGEAALRSIRSTHGKIAGHAFLVEQSERPAGPFIANYERTDELVDFKDLHSKRDSNFASLVYGGEAKQATDITIPPTQRADPGALSQAWRRLMLGPERVLLCAKAAQDLSLGPKVEFHGRPHQTLDFRIGDMPVRLFISADTFIPNAVETYEQPATFMFGLWGDSRLRTVWSTWDLRPGKIKFPSQWTEEFNGIVTGERTYLSVDLDRTESGDPKIVPPTVPQPLDGAALVKNYRKVDIAEGIAEYVGSFNTSVVETKEGLFVIDCVLNSSFAQAFLARLATDYPYKPVLGVISTDDAWPHVAGVRQFVAKDIPVYALDLNRPLLERFVANPHKILPDALQKAPRAAHLVTVKQRLRLGSGPNRMEVIPVRGSVGERAQMIYFPEKRILFTADMVQFDRQAKLFAPGAAQEVVQAVQREGLTVDQFFGMHVPPMAWSKLQQALKAVDSGQ